MKVKVIRIGNSKGVRLPRTILEQCEVSESFDLRVDGKKIVLVPLAACPRSGWAEAARRMAEAGDDQLLLPDWLPEDEDVEW